MASIDETENSELSGLDDAGNNTSNGLRSHASRRYREVAVDESSQTGIFLNYIRSIN